MHHVTARRGGRAAELNAHVPLLQFHGARTRNRKATCSLDFGNFCYDKDGTLNTAWL